MDRILLVGAEAVEAASSRMSDAAETMRQALAWHSEALDRHRIDMEALVCRLEALVAQASTVAPPK